MGKQSFPAWNAKNHASELTQKLLARLHTDSVPVPYVRQDGEESGLAVGWQFDGASDGVNVPSQHILAGAPTCVPL
jgi:hypothetical protein